MEYIKNFKESLKLGNKFWLVVLMDLIFYAIFVPVFFIYGFIVNKKALYLQQVIGTTDVLNYLETASALEINMMTADLRGFIIVFLVGILIVFLIGLFSYSYSRSLIWNYLLERKFNFLKYLKFNWLNLLLLIALAILIALYSFFMIINQILFGIILLFLMIGIMYFIFALYIEYTKTGRIFHSIGNAFMLMDKKVYLLCLPVFIIISLISFIISLFVGQTLNSIISIILLILFATWMRIFILKSHN